MVPHMGDGPPDCPDVSARQGSDHPLAAHRSHVPLFTGYSMSTQQEVGLVFLTAVLHGQKLNWSPAS